MAENDKEDIPEQVDDEGSDAESGKKGLSTGLLIKIAIGLAVLLIVLAGGLFFFKSSEQTSFAENGELDTTQQTVAENKVIDSDQPKTSATVSEESTSTNTSTSEKALAQILELQQQISDLKVENQNLNEEITSLTNKNNDLKKEVEVFTREINSTEIPLNQLINTQDLPRDYRRETYANSPKFELEPKWGEFENTANNNE